MIYRKLQFIAVIPIFIIAFASSNLFAHAAHQVPETDINYDETTDVQASHIVYLPDTNGDGYLEMPSDLPEGSTLTVSNLNESDIAASPNESGIMRCEEVYEFKLETPANTNYSDSFVLALPYCNGLMNQDLYTYNENDGKWIPENGDIYGIQEHVFIVSTDLDEISKHGAFGDWEEITDVPEDDQTEENNEQEHPDEISLPFNENSPIYAGQKIAIEGTNSFLIMPDDLPDGTFIEVEDASTTDFVSGAAADHLEVDGDVFTVHLDTPDKTLVRESFTLGLDSNDADNNIYYYNEEENEWEKQEGTYNEEQSTITTHPEHFSTYGVFTETKDEDYVCYENEAEMNITINFDEEINVCPGQHIWIEDTGNYIFTPEDLPKNTKLMVSNVGEADIVADAEGLQRAGDVLDFTITTLEDIQYSEEFRLKMPYGNGFEADDIYYYNEETDAWKKQDAAFDYEDNTLNVTFSNLSVYGVFAIAESTTDNEDEDNETEENVEDSVEDKDSEDSDENDGGFTLPQTATDIFNWILIGGLLIGAGLLFMFFLKRKKKKKQN